MHIFFSGIGGAGIGPLALIAYEAGYTVSGSDKQDSSYLAYLKDRGITNIHVGQTTEAINAVHADRPIDWIVYSSALPMENPNHPELQFAIAAGIRATKRDEFITALLAETGLEMIAIAGTHGKTTTTAMTVWLMQQINQPISYLLPAKTSFASLGSHNPKAQYFVYEADEFDRNFLAYSPKLSVITGIDWDHPDIYPTRQEYYEAFTTFINQSETVISWRADTERIQLPQQPKITVLDQADPAITAITLPGEVNRQNAWQVVNAVGQLTGQPIETLISHMNRFPGLGRRFEQIVPGLYTDYAHTPPKIRGALQLGHEVAGDKLVVVYEGLHNTRQHFIREELATIFDSVKQLYIVPSYLAREDESLELLTPEKLVNGLSAASKQIAHPAQLDDALAATIQQHLAAGDTILCLTAGGGNSLDEWLRSHFVNA